MDEARAHNIPEFSVAEIAGAIRATLEGAFSRVRVRGEVTELKRHTSGHVYLTLKDEGGKLAGVIWRSALPRIGLDPENGVEVIATGRITTYGDRSTYQLTIERLEFAGAGALLARIEALRQRLLAEGLFEEGRKRPLPVLPRLIGVVTSETGAVIRDILTTVARRFPRDIVLWPVPVQGQGAAERIAAAIAGFSAMPVGDPLRPDVVIVARGGGGLEDLMAFNEEAVVRAAAASTIPLISAVGHETDTTLIDFASDRRAPTPTAAAELAIPARADLVADLDQRGARLTGALARRLSAARLAVQQAGGRLPDLPGIVDRARQRLDDRAERFSASMPVLLRARRGQLAELGLRLPHPREQIAARRGSVALLDQRLHAGLRRLLDRRGDAAARCGQRLSPAPLLAQIRHDQALLAGISGRLESVSYRATLERGFVLVTDPKGHAVTRAAGVAPGARLTLTFADGTARVSADRAPAGQGSLL